MTLGSSALLRALEEADEEVELHAWSEALTGGLRRAPGVRAIQLLRVLDEGRELEHLGSPDPLAEEILRTGHASLDESQRRRIYRSGATVVSIADVHGDGTPDPLARSMHDAGVADVLGLVAPPGVSLGLFLERPARLEPKARQLWLSFACFLGVGAALRSEAKETEAHLDDDLPRKLRGALGELERRRRRARRSTTSTDARSALRFLGALADEGYAVVREQRVGRSWRLVAVRPKDPETRSLRGLDEGERAVLDGLRRGLSLKEIAFELQIAEPTVSGRVARIRAKLGVDPRSALVHLADLGDTR